MYMIRRWIVALGCFGVFCSFAYVFMDKPLFFYAFVFIGLIIGAFYWHADRLFLSVMGAREVTDVEWEDLFQRIKNRAFYAAMPCPKIYIYQGTLKKFFILKTFGRLSLLVEEELAQDLATLDNSILIDLALRQPKGVLVNLTLFNFFCGGTAFVVNTFLKALRLLGVSKRFREGIALPAWVMLYCLLYFFRFVLVGSNWSFHAQQMQQIASLDSTDIDKGALYMGLNTLLQGNYLDRGKSSSIRGVETIV